MKGSGPHCGRWWCYPTSWGSDSPNELGGVSGLRWMFSASPSRFSLCSLLRRHQWAPCPFQGQDSGPAATPPGLPSPTAVGEPHSVRCQRAGWRGKRKLVPGSRSPSKWMDGHLPTCTPGCVFSFPVLGGHSCSSM